jgi:hypothetical protein
MKRRGPERKRRKRRRKKIETLVFKKEETF